MTHSEPRTVWWKEGIFAVFGGIVYGATNVIVGHPFDTIKTKLQAERQHMSSEATVTSTARRIMRNEGTAGFYRGGGIVAAGTISQRSCVVSSYEACFTALAKHESYCRTLPFSGGLEYRTILAGFVAGSIRSILECPFEYAKVRL